MMPSPSMSSEPLPFSLGELDVVGRRAKGADEAEARDGERVARAAAAVEVHRVPAARAGERVHDVGEAVAVDVEEVGHVLVGSSSAASRSRGGSARRTLRSPPSRPSGEPSTLYGVTCWYPNASSRGACSKQVTGDVAVRVFGVGTRSGRAGAAPFELDARPSETWEVGSYARRWKASRTGRPAPPRKVKQVTSTPERRRKELCSQPRR